MRQDLVDHIRRSPSKVRLASLSLSELKAVLPHLAFQSRAWRRVSAQIAIRELRDEQQ